MTTFEDGPAAGEYLSLKRAPLYLRVTDNGSVWDALDQVGDTPRPNETLHCYRLKEPAGNCHVHRQGGGGWFKVATYVYVSPQPSDAKMRTTGAWRNWTAKQTVPDWWGDKGKS